MSEYNERSGEYKQQGEYHSSRTPQAPKKDSDLGSWIFIAVMFAIAWPVGLFLLISKLSDGSKKRTGTTGKMTMETAADKVSRVISEHRPVQQRAASVTKTPQYSAKGAKIMQIVGAALAIVGAMALAGAMGDVSFYLRNGFWWDVIAQLFFPTGVTAGGIAVWLGGRSMAKRNRRFGKYLAVAGKREAVPIAWLANAAEVSEHKVEKDLEIMVEKGLWGEEAYVDSGNGMLFRSPAAASAHFGAQKQPAAAPVQADEGYSGILRQIRRANDRIADPILSAKIDRLEDVTAKIFRIIEREPAKKDKAGTFLNYYLPTTQKLLDSYAEFEEAGVSGDNLTQAKAKIEQTMDNVVAGFERQLDELYHADAMDIDSDIRVMETMLRRDNSSAEEDFGLGAYAMQEEME